LIIIVFILIVYGQTINFDFVYLDDDKIIIDHQDKISSLSKLTEAFRSEYGFDQGTPFYRPIVITSFIIDAQFSKTDPAFYHLTNIIIHLLTTIILFVLFRDLAISKETSFFLTSVFAIHPLLTNAIVWIPGRNDLLATFFSLIAFRFFIIYSITLSKKYYFLHFLFFLLAILSKEVALVLPLLFIVYIIFYRKENFKWNYLLRFILLWIFIIAAFQLVKVNVVGDLGNVLYGIPALMTNIQVIPEVIFNIFLPIKISVLPTFSLTTTIGGIMIFVVLLVIPLTTKKLNRKYYYFGLIWFLIFLLPGLSVVYADHSEKFDYLDSRAYLPIIGILIILSELISFITLKIPKQKKFFSSTSFFIVIIFSVLTFFQSKKYENAVSFAESAILSNPERPFFYHKLADYYFEIKDYEKAVHYMRIALIKSPEKFFYYKNLILAYMELNQYDNAIESANEALSIKPDDNEMIRALVLIYYRRGDLRNALVYADKYISLGGIIDNDFYKKLITSQR